MRQCSLPFVLKTLISTDSLSHSSKLCALHVCVACALSFGLCALRSWAFWGNPGEGLYVEIYLLTLRNLSGYSRSCLGLGALQKQRPRSSENRKESSLVLYYRDISSPWQHMHKTSKLQMKHIRLVLLDCNALTCAGHVPTSMADG